MKLRNRLIAVLLLVSGVAAAQAPLLHYHFNLGSLFVPSTTSTDNAGSLGGQSPMQGLMISISGPNGTACLYGSGTFGSAVTTPFSLTLGTGSWTVGFAINAQPAATIADYVFSEDVATGWRAVCGGGVPSGALRMTGGGCPTIDVAGGAPVNGWAHVAFVHDAAANSIIAYKNGVPVSVTPAPNVDLSSGNTLVIGRNTPWVMQVGTQIDDFRLYDYALAAPQVQGWSQAALDESAQFRKVMMTEISWSSTARAIELTNFGASSASLTNWRIRWRMGGTSHLSTPINLTLAPGESAVVADDVLADSIPPGTQVVDRFAGTITVTSSALTIALLDPIGTATDEVVAQALTGFSSVQSAGGIFRGTVTRTSTITSAGRIWGLDSDSEGDWTTQSVRTLGRENTSGGVRGIDPLPVSIVHINEIDDNPDFIELYNPDSNPRDLSGWFFWMSASNNTGPSIATIPNGTILPATGYAVFGDGAAAPAEMPGSVAYVQLTAIPFVVLEYECALYDRGGRLIDLVRSTREGTQLVHNHPRAPSSWNDFFGAAPRLSIGGDKAIGRSSSSNDTNSGSNWYPIFTRTMGSPNLASTQAGPSGFGDALDVRLNETGLGQGFLAIVNAGPSSSGLQYNFLISTTHANGAGIFLGLAADALANLPAFYHVAPFWGHLDLDGAARIEFPSGSLPPGIDADFIFFIQDGANQLVARTLVLEFDT